MKRFIADMKMFWKTAKHIESLCRGIMILNIIEVFFNALSPFVGIYMSARVLDMILAGAPTKETLVMAALAAGLAFLVRMMKAMMAFLIAKRRAILSSNYALSKNRKVAELDYDLVDNADTQKTLNRIYQQEHMNNGGLMRFYYMMPTMVENIFTIVFSVSLTLTLFVSPYPRALDGITKFVVTPYFAILILAFCAFSVWLSAHGNTKYTRFETKSFQSFTFENQLGDSLYKAMTEGAGPMNVRIYNQKGLITKTWQILDKRAVDMMDGCARYRMAHATLPGTVMNTLMQIVLYAFAGLGALVGRFSVGSIAKYISSILKFMGAVGSLVSNFEILRCNNEITKIYFDFIEIPSHMYQGTLPVEKRNDRDYEVEFRDVSFRYPKTDSWALRHVNFKFKVGERLAVVGMNGSGKTTMIKLMCRLYDPTEGQILLNGIDIRKYDYKEYHSIFSVVFQDFKLFAFTLGQNVAAGMEYDEERVKKCLIEANFGERLKTLEKGTETYLYRNFERNGVSISGGEAQKIALARALYKNAPFIILDEPTAALDPIAEAEVYSNFNSIVGDKTAIYISHRLSSCRFCDRIAVFDGGSIVQFGTHEALVADKEGKYYALWNAQAQYYAEGSA